MYQKMRRTYETERSYLASLNKFSMFFLRSLSSRWIRKFAFNSNVELTTNLNANHEKHLIPSVQNTTYELDLTLDKFF